MSRTELDRGTPLDVGFPAERSIPEWEERHARGEVPGRWPYGLDALSTTRPTRAVALPAPGRVARLRRKAGWASRARTDAVGVTWDENAALRMQTVRPYLDHVSGVIWVTDAAERGAPVAGMIRALRGCRRLWVLSDAQVEPLAALLGDGGPAVDHLRFGIDETFFAARPYPAVPRVLSVGGDRDRDARTLFAALEKVHTARPDAELVVQTTSTATPPAGVRTVRHVPHAELRELYAEASVIAIATSPNLHVSGMTVSLEAMSTGRPVAITRSPGMADYVDDGETGLLSATGDPAALAESILSLLEDPAAAARMGETARARVEERFTSTGMAARIAAIATDRG